MTIKNKTTKTSIIYQLQTDRTIISSDDSQPTGVIKPVNGILTFLLTANVYNLTKSLSTPRYKDRGPTADKSRQEIKIISQNIKGDKKNVYQK